MREFTVKKNDAGQRLDKFVAKALPSLPPALLYKSIRLKKIKVNRKRAEGKQMLAEGDTVQLFLAEEFFEKGDGNRHALFAVKPRLDVLYEDENIILLNKRPGVSVHEDEKGDNDTLITHLQAYLAQKGEYKPDEEQSFAPALCNRIDRNTGGIVIAAKNAESLREMNAAIKARTLDKRYLCVVHGTPRPASATMEGYLLKDATGNTVRIYDKNPPKGAKSIQTRYKTIKSKNGISLLEVTLLTGRTHQIRAHLSHLGYPLLGDGKYGVNRHDKAIGYKYQALWSYRLSFSFPEDNTLSYLNGRVFSVPEEKIYF
ncbi:MAG: RluA family pseudouridine synthase, partial [Clostridia bacterium]|nr:RluA family pseudouridine synthase [Clostridia bacterium]